MRRSLEYPVSAPLVFEVRMEAHQCASVKSGGPSLPLRGAAGPSRLEPTYRLRGGVPTKGSPVTSVGDFNVWGYHYDAWDPAGTVSNFCPGFLVERSGGDYVFALDDADLGDLRWPSSGKVRFFALSPAVGAELGVASAPAGYPSFVFEASPSCQVDYLVAESAEMSSPAVVRLPFRHLLSAVTFSACASEGDVTLRRIVLSGIYTQARFTGTDVTGQAESGVSFEFDFGSGLPLPGGEPVQLTSDERTVLAVPQVCPEGAMVFVEYEKDGAVFSSYASLAGQSWDPGVAVDYLISL